MRLTAAGWFWISYISGWVLCLVLIVLFVGKMDYQASLEQDNDRLKRAFNALLIAEGDGSCSVLNNGPKINCYMLNGIIRTDLAPDPDRCPPKIRRIKRRGNS